jgi:hypothetical protein
MRGTWFAAGLALLAASCATPPMSPQEQAAHFGDVPPAPTKEELAGATFAQAYRWIERPTDADYTTVWPQDAWWAEVEASVDLDCLVLANGRVACAASDDGWPQYHFEQGARNLSTRLLMDTSGENARLVGQRVQVRISFRFAN